jgi:DNA-binding Lrp family transcriptional regulator
MGSKKMKNAEKPRNEAFATRPLHDRDSALLAILLANPEATPTQVAKQMGIPPDSVRRRWAALRGKGALREVTLVNRRYTGFAVRAMISIDLDPPALCSRNYGYSDQQNFCAFLRAALPRHKEFRRFTQRVKVESVSIVLGGRCDLVAFVAAPDPEAICDFVTRVLRFLPGVQNTNTAMVFGEQDCW